MGSVWYARNDRRQIAKSKKSVGSLGSQVIPLKKTLFQQFLYNLTKTSVYDYFGPTIGQHYHLEDQKWFIVRLKISIVKTINRFVVSSTHFISIVFACIAGLFICIEGQPVLSKCILVARMEVIFLDVPLFLKDTSNVEHYSTRASFWKLGKN